LVSAPLSLHDVQANLQIRFADEALLRLALTHPSYTNEHEGSDGSFERLEFLGDAVLGFVISDRLFRECPDWNEGQKSKARAALVSSVALAGVGERLGLGAHLLLGRGEERTGGRAKRSLIADTFEAVVAAVYLDGGVEAADRFIERWFRPQLDAVRAGGVSRGMTRDHKSALQEWLQSRDRGLPRYELVGTSGPPHRRIFETEIRVGERALARGEGASKKESEQRAAERALAAVEASTESAP
jgi:ribonuclease-3